MEMDSRMRNLGTGIPPQEFRDQRTDSDFK